MPENIETHLNSSAPVEVIAGDVLEQLAKAGQTSGLFLSNLSASMSGESPGGAPSPRALRVLEAFQWLLSRDLLATGSQAGTIFVTAKGKQVGTAERLKSYLDEQASSAEAAGRKAADELAEMKKGTETELAALRNQAASEIATVLAEAKKEAASILSLARKTAEGVSLKDVQQQFADAAKQCLSRIHTWAALSWGSVAALIVTLVCFMTRWLPSFQASNPVTTAYPTMIYQTVIRVTLLTAIGAIASFCFKVLRAQMHLREQNLHRARLANTMDAFLGAASSPEQRDIILARLLDAIAAFGNSGLLVDTDESMSPAKLILESIPRLSPKG